MKERRTIPVTKGKTYEIEIIRLGTNGEGVGKYQDFTVFIPYALPGERIVAVITTVKKTYAVGKLRQVLCASPARVAPTCAVYYRCGACQLQHFSYDGELQEKQRQVQDALTRIGHITNVPVLPTLGAATPWNYRNKMQFPVGEDKKNTLSIGCFAAATHNVINVENCVIQKEENNQIVRIVRQWMKDFKIPAYDEDKCTGMIRHIMGRVGVKTGEIMVCIVTACECIPHIKDLIRRLRQEIPGLTAVIQNINTGHTNVILGRKTRTLYGQDTIHDAIGNLRFHISAQSFFQVNSEQAQRLYEKALEFADLKGHEIVADVYCGTGTITLFLAQKAKQVYGIEIVPSAIKDAIRNARDNHIKNAEFILGDAVYKLPELIKNGVRPQVIVLDPPRAGCGEPVLRAIGRSQPERVVYVSCNPATLARDLACLQTYGYKTERVQPVDMFSRTHHVECIALIQRVKS